MVTTRRAAAAAANGGEASPTTPASPARQRAGRSPARNGHQAGTNGAAHPTSAQHQHQYEFFGPHGPLALIFVLPVVVYGLYLGCNVSGCLKVWPALSIPGLPAGTPVFSWEATGVFLAWFFGLVALHLALPGQKAQGVVLPDGSRLTYKLNGEQCPGCCAWRVAQHAKHITHFSAWLCAAGTLLAVI